MTSLLHVTAENFRSWLRNHPQAFDRLRAISRPLGLRKEESWAFFDEFSRALDRRVVFLQIGANDGLHNDPIREFVVRDKWKGVFVEPMPSAFALLTRNYRYLNRDGLRFVNAAIGGGSVSELVAFSFSDEYLAALPFEEGLRLIRKTSFDRDLVERAAGKAHRHAIVEVDLPCLSVEAVIEQFLGGRVPDLLVIDAEGYEPAIIRSIDFGRIRPRAIFYESHHLGDFGPTLVELLRNAGYRVEVLHGDTVATLRD